MTTGITKRPELLCAESAARKAGALILDHAASMEIRHKESNYNLITSADLLSQKTIVECIRESFPDDAILGEESTADLPPLDAERLWILDPIDGTTNYAHRIPHFSISIAYAEKGEVLCGVVADPSMQEYFSAERSRGAWCNDAPIHVTSAEHLTDAVVGTGFYYERGTMMKKTLDAVETLLRANIQGIRRMGSAALDLCYVACGRFDAYFEYGLSPWDFAAGYLIVKEAGGICLDSDETDQGIHAQSILSCTPHLKSEFLPIVAWDELSASAKNAPSA